MAYSIARGAPEDGVMLVVIPQPVRDMPARWRKRVEERRALTTVDAAADALETAARELDAAIAAAVDTSRMLSTTEYAAHAGIRPGTVRKWCARGELQGARKDGADDWQIPATAARVRKPRSRSDR
jgi:hypothetical protein